MYTKGVVADVPTLRVNGKSWATFRGCELRELPIEKVDDEINVVSLNVGGSSSS
jgi:hypothetical protein